MKFFYNASEISPDFSQVCLRQNSRALMMRNLIEVAVGLFVAFIFYKKITDPRLRYYVTASFLLVFGFFIKNIFDIVRTLKGKENTALMKLYHDQIRFFRLLVPFYLAPLFFSSEIVLMSLIGDLWSMQGLGLTSLFLVVFAFIWFLNYKFLYHPIKSEMIYLKASSL